VTRQTFPSNRLCLLSDIFVSTLRAPLFSTYSARARTGFATCSVYHGDTRHLGTIVKSGGNCEITQSDHGAPQPRVAANAANAPAVTRRPYSRCARRRSREALGLGPAAEDPARAAH